MNTNKEKTNKKIKIEKLKIDNVETFLPKNWIGRIDGDIIIKKTSNTNLTPKQRKNVILDIDDKYSFIHAWTTDGSFNFAPSGIQDFIISGKSVKNKNILFIASIRTSLDKIHKYANCMTTVIDNFEKLDNPTVPKLQKEFHKCQKTKIPDDKMISFFVYDE